MRHPISSECSKKEVHDSEKSKRVEDVGGANNTNGHGTETRMQKRKRIAHMETDAEL